MTQSATVPRVHRTQSVPVIGLAYLVVVYLVWGSTYLAIRIAVGGETGFPPFMMSGGRVLVAGLILLLWSVARGQRVRLSRDEMAVLAASGLLLWVGGNGLVVWAEQRADSGYAALLVSSTPIWVAIMESALDRRPPTLLLATSLLVGLGGVGLLTAPALLTGGQADPASALALVLASVAWGAGSLLQHRRPVGVGPLASSAYQHLAGSLGFLVLIALAREPLPTPTAEATLAWGYLIVFGSLLGFTSFVQALRLLPANIAMTYAYVNPAIAVALGALILREPVTAWTAAGMAGVLLGVAGVFHDRYRQSRNSH